MGANCGSASADCNFETTKMKKPSLRRVIIKKLVQIGIYFAQLPTTDLSFLARLPYTYTAKLSPQPQLRLALGLLK